MVINIIFGERMAFFGKFTILCRCHDFDPHILLQNMQENQIFKQIPFWKFWKARNLICWEMWAPRQAEIGIWNMAFGIWEIWNNENARLRCWNFELLKLWNFEMLKLWILELCHFETLKLWHWGIWELLNFGTLDRWNYCFWWYWMVLDFW